MPVPVLLRPYSISRFFEVHKTVKTPLAKYWLSVPNRLPGIHIMYDLKTFGRERGRVNTRGGPPYYEEGPAMTVITLAGETWRDGIHIQPEEINDLRKVGTPAEKRGESAVADALVQLGLRHDRFEEWQRAEAMQGVKTFYPPGLDEAYSELLLCSEDCLIPEVVGGWDDAMADEAAARARLEEIRVDFETARLALAAVGLTLEVCVGNSTTFGYIDAAAIMAGIDVLYDSIMLEGRLLRLFGVDLERDDEMYIHPITGAATYYIPDNVAIFTDRDNARTGRAMVHCEAVNTRANGAIGLFWDSQEVGEAPRGVDVSGEDTMGPMIPIDCSFYNLQDVTAEIGL